MKKLLGILVLGLGLIISSGSAQAKHYKGEKNLNIMNVFIILSILIIVIGVLLIVVTPSVLFKFNWNEKTGLEKILVILFYCILLYIINIIYWFIN